MSGFRFNRMELAGSLGDLGTLLPLLIPLVVINGVNATLALLLIGFFYVGAGLYYKIPMPVQPLKYVAAATIIGGLSASAIAGAGLIVGIFLLCLGVTGLINRVARVFSKPVVRGVQVGLGLMLFIKGIGFITDSKLFVGGEAISFFGLPFNLLVGIIGISIAALLLTNKRLPAAIALIAFGFSIGLAFKTPSLALGPQMPPLQLPTVAGLWAGLMLLAIPQIPLTLSNAVISTSELSKKLLKRRASRVSCRALTNSIGVANLGAGLLGGVPMCHGAGGLAAHYRFGARTGGSNLMIGGIFIALALLFGATAISLLGLIPLSILGVLLIFTGIQLMRMLTDVKEKKDLFVVFVIVGLAALTNMAVAFGAGIVLYYLVNYCFRGSIVKS
jgi:SulP family sulfate permease